MRFRTVVNKERELIEGRTLPAEAQAFHSSSDAAEAHIMKACIAAASDGIIYESREIVAAVVQYQPEVRNDAGEVTQPARAIITRTMAGAA